MSSRFVGRAKSGIAAIALLLFVVGAAQASSIVVGTHILALDTPNQQVDLYIFGTDHINAIDLFMTINGGIGPAPIVTAVDIVGPGTLLAGNNFVNFLAAPWNLPGLQPAVIAVPTTGTVVANGLLARVTFSTVGIPLGLYTWSLTDHDLGATDIGTDENGETVYPTITNGLIWLDPEPSSLVLGSIMLLSLGLATARSHARRRGWLG